MEQKHVKRFVNNPFPKDLSGLGFVESTLFFDPVIIPTQSWSVGNDHGFIMKWNAEMGGALSVFHVDDPEKIVWSTAPGVGFVSAASGSCTAWESRGSFALKDHIRMVLPHQTIEVIQVAFPQQRKDGKISLQMQSPLDSSLPSCIEDNMCSKHLDGDGTETAIRGAALVITGFLHSHKNLAARSSKASGRPVNSNTSSLIDRMHQALQRVAPEPCGVFARYWLTFAEKRDHHLSFSLKVEQPLSYEHIIQKHSNLPDDDVLAKWHWLWAERPLINSNMKKNTAISNLCGNKSITPSIEMEQENATLSSTNEISQLPQLNRVMITYQSEKEEFFFGFGEQFSYMNMKGRRVPILVQEQGLGRGDQPVTALSNLLSHRAGGNWHTTYAPSPYYMTSKMRSLFLEVYDLSTFDLRRRNRVQVQVHASSMHGRILHGSHPCEILKRYTDAIGRMRELPAWILKGAIIGMQGGTEAVTRMLNLLQNLNVPIAAFWLQDWVGQRKTRIGWQLWWNWEVDTQHYPGWEELVRKLRLQGIRTMTYCNPLLASTEGKGNRRRDLLKEAQTRGFLVKNATGNPYMITNTSFDCATIDLTNPAARTWLKGILHDMVDTGVRGWMADFGEALPFSSYMFSGKNLSTMHNKFPELWAELNREFVEEWEDKRQKKQNVEISSVGDKIIEKKADGGEINANKHGENIEIDDDNDRLVFFMRAGYRSSPRWATLFWEGDQMVSWQRHDGIKSAVVGLLSSGISGYSLNHSDIGGYCTVDAPFLRYKRSQELLVRWMELNAFSVIFRTHEGNNPAASHQFYSNSMTLSLFARFAKVYKAWEFYRKKLVKEAASTGLPVVRHMFLHYPQDDYVQNITYEQFLVGSEIMVVPVLNKGRDSVLVYFPCGDEWVHIWTGDRYKACSEKGYRTLIKAPLGKPAVFVKGGCDVGSTFIENLTNYGLI